MKRPYLPVFALGLLTGFVACKMPQPSSEPTKEPEHLPIRARSLNVGVSAYFGEDPTSLMKPLVRYLERELGIPVSVRVAEPYVELPALLKSGEIDVAQLPPLAYVLIRRKLPGIRPVATPIIGGSPSYLGHIFVRSHSELRTLEDLRGHSVAFVSRDSSSGFLFPRELLRQRGHDPDRFFSSEFFVDNHPEAEQAVLSGLADVGTAFDATSDWTGQPERPQGLRVVAKTERIPNDCIAARPGYDPGAVLALRSALVALRPGVREAEEIFSSLKINGWLSVDDSRYDRIEEVLEKEALTTEPLGTALR